MITKHLRRGCLVLLTASFQFVGAKQMAAQEPTFTTLCAILKEPAAFSGKTVRLRAKVEIGMESSVIADTKEDCNSAWLEYARKSDDKSKEINPTDDSLQKAHPVFRIEDGNWKQFNDALAAQLWPRDQHMGYIGGLKRYTVTATMTGRVDYVGKDGWGFGHLNGWPVQFTLVAVSDVATAENAFDETMFSREPVRLPHGTIRGRLIGADGKGIARAWISAIPAAGLIPMSSPEILTEDDGSYSLDVDPGKYFIVANRDWPATEEVPVLTTYYPSSEIEAGAALLNVADYAELKDIDIRLKRTLVPRYFDVHVLGPDGKPTKVYTYLRQTNQAGIAGHEGGVTYTDAVGHVRLLVFEGLDYLLFAGLGSNSYEQCAPVEYLGKDRSNVEPIVVKISLQHEACNEQEDKARRAAYATHEREQH